MGCDDGEGSYPPGAGTNELAVGDVLWEGRGESVGVVDLVAIRKHHGKPIARTKRGDALQIILIQVKGGRAARPTVDDRKRLQAVAKSWASMSCHPCSAGCGLPDCSSHGRHTTRSSPPPSP